MKNTLQLNIGLNTNDGGTLAVGEAATAIRRAGLIITASRIVNGAWNGTPEQTLAVECLPALPICHGGCRLAILSAIGKLARELRQTCIALAWPEGHGELCPPQSGMEFDASLFHGVEAPTVPLKADCPPSEREQFIAYLEGTLIPDLEASGYEATAEDFKTCVRFMDKLTPARTPEVTSGW